MATSKKLSLGLIARVLGTEDPVEILARHTLRLQGLGLGSIGDLEALSSVEELYLGRNELKSLGPALLPLASSLVVLSLCFNRLQSIADAELHCFDSLRVLDLSHNCIEAIEASNELPLKHLTVLDLRENPCALNSFFIDDERAPHLQELNGVVRKQKSCTLSIPILGETPDEPKRRIVQLKLTSDDDFQRLARDFCLENNISKQEEAIPELLAMMQDAFSSCAESNQLAESYRSADIVKQVDTTYAKLCAFPKELDSSAQRAHSFASTRLEARREAMQERRLQPQPIPTKSAQLSEHEAAITARRRDFAERVRRQRISTAPERPADRHIQESKLESDQIDATCKHLYLLDDDDDEWVNDDKNRDDTSGDLIFFDSKNNPRTPISDFDDAIYGNDGKQDDHEPPLPVAA